MEWTANLPGAVTPQGADRHMASADHLALVVQLPLCILDGLITVESAFSSNAGVGEHT